MNSKPPPKPRLADFLHDLRKADPLFWVAAAIAALIFILRSLTGQP